MISSALSGETRCSILETIIAANYDEYTEQRWQLREIFQTNPRFAQYHHPPTPPPPPPASPPPAPPLPSSPPPTTQPPQEPQEKLTKLQRKQQASRDRAHRLRRLRPDIPSIPNPISNVRAMELGGYQTQSEMDKDLTLREKELGSTSQG